MKSRSFGFTLVELLLALAISAIIAIGTLQLFNTSITTKNTLALQSEEQSQLSRAIRVIETDLIQYAPMRRVRNAFGEFEPPIELTFDGLFLSRSGWAISRFATYERSQLQRVHYRVAEAGSELCEYGETNSGSEQGGCLIRSYLAHLDDDGSLRWYHQTLLRQVAALDWRFFIFDPRSNASNFESTPPLENPSTGTIDTYLKAIEFSVSLTTGGQYTRLVVVPDAVEIVSGAGE